MTGLTGCRNQTEPESPLTAYVLRRAASHPKLTAPLTVHVPVPAGQGDGRVSFADAAAKAGLRYRWTIPGPRPLDILQTIGSGCAFLDFNNDNNLDILLIGPHLALYQGDGQGHFADVTRSAGLDKFTGRFLGCAVGDYDNDGYDDISLTGYRTGLLLHNEGGRKFTDVTAWAGLKPQPWGAACAWADVDGDGRLDLFVGNYVQFDPARDRRFCDHEGHSSACSPLQYESSNSVLYHNDGGGRFRDVSLSTLGAVQGKVLGAAFADYDDSGRPSLYLANDEMPGSLLHNQPGVWADVGRASGTAFDSDFMAHAGMGTDWGDYDNDGRPDLTVAAFSDEPKCVYHNEGGGLFQEVSPTLGLSDRTRPYVAFGIKWLDVDNDGWLDLMITNGHVYTNIRDIFPDQSYRQPMQIFHNEHGKRFPDVSGQAGPDVTRPIVGRGLAVGDYDNDGRVDALVVDAEGAPLLLHNESKSAGHWLSLTLVGTRCNRDSYGARITATARGLTQTRWCHTDGSYLSASDKRIHLGFGTASVVDTLTVRWPDGHTDTRHHVRADRQLTLREAACDPKSD